MAAPASAPTRRRWRHGVGCRTCWRSRWPAQQRRRMQPPTQALGGRTCSKQGHVNLSLDAIGPSSRRFPGGQGTSRHTGVPQQAMHLGALPHNGHQVNATRSPPLRERPDNRKFSMFQTIVNKVAQRLALFPASQPPGTGLPSANDQRRFGCCRNAARAHRTHAPERGTGQNCGALHAARIVPVDTVVFYEGDQSDTGFMLLVIQGEVTVETKIVSRQCPETHSPC